MKIQIILDVLVSFVKFRLVNLSLFVPCKCFIENHLVTNVSIAVIFAIRMSHCRYFALSDIKFRILHFFLMQRILFCSLCFWILLVYKLKDLQILFIYLPKIIVSIIGWYLFESIRRRKCSIFLGFFWSPKLPNCTKFVIRKLRPVIVHLWDNIFGGLLFRRPES